MYILDTNFLADYLLGKLHFVEKYKELTEKQLYLSVITCAEILSGTEKEDIGVVNNFLDSFTIIPVSDDLARKAGITRKELIKEGYKKSIPDILIGQTAIDHNLILVTGNPKDFPQLAKRKLLMPFPD